MSETLAMSGYGAYVWSSVGLTVIVLVLCAVQAKRRYRNVLGQIRALADTQKGTMEKSQ